MILKQFEPESWSEYTLSDLHRWGLPEPDETGYWHEEGNHTYFIVQQGSRFMCYSWSRPIRIELMNWLGAPSTRPKRMEVAVYEVIPR